MKLHGKIQEKTAKKYRAAGYEVFVEATIPFGDGGFYRVDVLATKGKEKIAIEVGRVPERKIQKLKQLGYKTIQIPFHYVYKGKYYCICGHNWKPRKEKPKACPKCKQYLT